MNELSPPEVLKAKRLSPDPPPSNAQKMECFQFYKVVVFGYFNTNGLTLGPGPPFPSACPTSNSPENLPCPQSPLPRFSGPRQAFGPCPAAPDKTTVEMPEACSAHVVRLDLDPHQPI